MATNSDDIKLNTHHKNLLKRLAEEDGISPAEVLTAAVDAYAKKKYSSRNGNGQESCYDVAKRAGIIGMVQNAPPDLSTNPKHFQGFGSD